MYVLPVFNEILEPGQQIKCLRQSDSVHEQGLKNLQTYAQSRLFVKIGV